MKFYVQVFLVSIICLKCLLISLYLFQQPSISLFTGGVAIAASEAGGVMDKTSPSADADITSAPGVAEVSAAPLTDGAQKKGGGPSINH